MNICAEQLAVVDPVDANAVNLSETRNARST
jgi:hypothetical protein